MVTHESALLSRRLVCMRIQYEKMWHYDMTFILWKEEENGYLGESCISLYTCLYSLCVSSFVEWNINQSMNYIKKDG